MSHIYIRDDLSVIIAQSFKFTHGTKYGSTYLASPIFTPCSIHSLDDGVASSTATAPANPDLAGGDT